VSHNDDNEIELIDILRVLTRRWKFILAGVFISTLCGVGVSQLLSKQYQFSSVVQIGRAPGGSQSDQTAQLYESPETVIAKLGDVYIPLSRQAVNENDIEVPEVNIKHPKNSDLVQLFTKAEASQKKLVELLHGHIVDLLNEDHAHRKERFVLALEANIARAKLRLQELQDPLEKSLREKRSQAAIKHEESLILRLMGEMEIYNQQLGMISARKERLQKRVRVLRDALRLAVENRTEVAENSGRESRAITLVMLDHQIDQDRIQLAEIENALLFDLDKERKTLEQKKATNLREQDKHKNRIDELKNSYLKEEADNQRQQKSQKQTIEELQGRLSLNEDTRTVSLAVRSTSLVSPSPIMVIALFFVCGGFATIFVAFLLDYIKRNPLKEA